MTEATDRRDTRWPGLSGAVAEAVDALGRPRELTVLINDPQRHTDSRPVLRRLVDEAGVRKMRILMAAGTHRFDASRRQAFERPLAALPVEQIAWHDSKSDLVSIGGKWMGHPWLLEPPAVLAVGSVEPHYFAGFTGAHKTLTVGCASWADIEANHAHALDPRARPTRLSGNPVYEGVAGMLAALTQRRAVAAINLVQSGSRVLRVEGGDPLETLRRLVPLAREMFVRELPRPADAVVAEVTGALARSFYQADKGIKNCEQAVRDGGAVVLLAACPDGIGQDHFVSLLAEAPTHARARQIVARRGYRLGDHKAVRLRSLTDPDARNVRVYVVSSGLSAEDCRVLGLVPATSEGQALQTAGIDPDSPGVVRVDDAGNTCLVCAP